MDKNTLRQNIDVLKNKKNAVIVAHYYQVDEVQEIADMTGDSFALAKFCASSDREVIVFCGVHFMAESANILSPEKTVLLTDIDAGCPMADMAEADQVRQMKKAHPEAAVVCYINTSAEIKAESDICCTSSNAVRIVESLPQKDIIFVPDQNLGSYISRKLPQKNFILWKGYCSTHHRIKTQDVLKAREKQPDAKLLVHPECRPEVVEMADFVGSTKQIIDHAASSRRNKFIIGTEMGVLYRLKKDNPRKTFYLLSQGLVCPNMKKTSLDSIYRSLLEEKYKIVVPEDIRNRAKGALDRMLSI